MSSKDHRRSARILELEAKKAQRAMEKHKTMYTAGSAQGPSIGKDQSSQKQVRKKVKVRIVQDVAVIPVEQHTHKITNAFNDVDQQGNANQAIAKSSVTTTPEITKLELLLTILQRRDSFNIFAHPVDPNEVAGYYNVIKDPMDFSTIATKLSRGKYKALVEFEADVYLVFNNAMLFNSSHTIFYRQARSIKEVATKLFHALRSKPDSFEAEFSILKLATGRWTSAESRLINSYSSDKNSCDNQSNQIAFGGLCGRRPGTSIQQPRDTYKPLAGWNRSPISSIYPGPRQLMVRNPKYTYGDSLRSFCQGLGKSAQTFAMQKLQIIFPNPKQQMPGYQACSVSSLENGVNSSLLIKRQGNFYTWPVESSNSNGEKFCNCMNLGKLVSSISCSGCSNYQGSMDHTALMKNSGPLQSSSICPLQVIAKSSDHASPSSCILPSKVTTKSNGSRGIDSVEGFVSTYFGIGGSIAGSKHEMGSSYQGPVEHNEPRENDGSPIPSCTWAPHDMNNSGVSEDFSPLIGLNAANVGMGGHSLPSIDLAMNSSYQNIVEEADQTSKLMLPTISRTIPEFDLNQEQSRTLELNGVDQNGMPRESRPLEIDFIGQNGLLKQSAFNITKDGVPEQFSPSNFNHFGWIKTLQYQDMPPSDFPVCQSAGY